MKKTAAYLLAVLKGAVLWLLTVMVLLYISLCHIDGITAMPEDHGRTETFLMEDVHFLLPAAVLLGLYVWLGWRRLRRPAKQGDRLCVLTAFLLNLLLIEYCVPFLQYSTPFAGCVIAATLAVLFVPGILLILFWGKCSSRHAFPAQTT